MAPHTSPFFSNVTGYSMEQSLVDDLTREQIKLYGVDIFYMPRKHLNHDKLLHEGSKSAFELALSIPMYIKSFSGYQNGMELLTKFGVRNSDEVTMVMSRSEWDTSYAPYVKSYYQAIEGTEMYVDTLDKNIGHTAARPKEGDLIYFPFDDGIFEVKYVMFDQPFFQLGQGYVFELQCEKFEYSGESFSTGYSEIDDTQQKPDYFRLEFELARDGQKQFEPNEEVLIYNLDTVSSTFLTNELGKFMLTENYDVLVTKTPDGFQLYKDPGYIERVESIVGKVMEWNSVRRLLTLGDMQNYDPDQMSVDTGEIDYNKFDSVLIIGRSSGAAWTSVGSKTMDTAFSDNVTIQNEFNDIKVIDLADENPFGFI